MKRTLFILSFLFVIFTFTSCSQEKTVKTVATNYLTALKNFDLEGAKKYGTDNAIKFLEEMQNYLKQSDPQEMQRAKEISKNVEVIIEKVSVKDSTAVVTYYFQEKNKPVRKETLNLVKKEGKWLADEDESW